MEPCRVLPVAVGVIAALGFVVAPGASSGGSKTIPDVTKLFDQAAQVVDATYPGAIMIEADGITENLSTTTSPKDTVEWRFIFSTPNSGIIHSSEISCGLPPEGFGPVQGKIGLFFGDLPLTNAPKMKVARAAMEDESMVAGDTVAGDVFPFRKFRPRPRELAMRPASRGLHDLGRASGLPGISISSSA